MKARKHPDAAYSALKAVYRRLIEHAGGLEAAAMITRVGKTTLGACSQLTHDFHLPADVILDLEAEIGDPSVTRVLARYAGYQLVPLAGRAGAPTLDPNHMVTKLARDIGDVAQAVEDMDEDGIREPHEMRRCISEMSELGERVHRCLDMLQQQLADMTAIPRE